MLAIEISHPGGPDVLRLAEYPKPVPENGEVLIRVEAAGVARADTLQRKGHYPPPPGITNIPGLDIAGTVESVGSGVETVHPGDRVCAILGGGGYAEYCAVPAVQVLPIPEGWSAIEAASLPENIFTVYDNMITRAGLQSGDTVLIHGGSSGIGTIAIMLARAWRAVPIVTAGSDQKCAACVEIGAEHAINYKTTDFVQGVHQRTNGQGVNVVLDLVGGAYLQKNIDMLAVEGRVSIIATQGGRTAELDILKLMHKRGRVMGSTMRVRTPAEKGDVAQRLLRDIWPMLPAKNPIRPIIDKVFRLADARLAHERMESGSHIGKIVLRTE